MNPKDEALKLIKKYKTNDPFELADCLNIVMIKQPLGKIKGCYKLIKKNKVIFLNSDLNSYEKRVICAHELGHAVMHPKVNCKFLQNYTLFSTDKIEFQANKFSAHLLLTDEIIMEYEGFTSEQLAAAVGVPKEYIYLLKR